MNCWFGNVQALRGMKAHPERTHEFLDHAVREMTAHAERVHELLIRLCSCLTRNDGIPPVNAQLVFDCANALRGMRAYAERTHKLWIRWCRCLALADGARGAYARLLDSAMPMFCAK